MYSHTRLPGNEAGPRTPEIEPVEYIDAVRDFLYENSDSARVPSHATKAQMKLEAGVSAAFVEGICADPTDETATPADAEWARDGFSQLMSLLVKASAKAADHETGVMPFSDIHEHEKETIRRCLFAEYVEVCDMLAIKDKPSKTLANSPIFLYRTPENIRAVVTANEDLGLTNVANVLVHYPVSAEAVLEDGRSKIEKAKELFPTISHIAIRSGVLNAPGNYEHALRTYAERHGIVVNLAEQKVPDAPTFIKLFREMLRTKPAGLSGLNSPEEVVEAARTLGEEAMSINPEDATEDPMHISAYEDEVVREAFRGKVELFIEAADDAWRHGALPASPIRMPEALRTELYAQLLGDFLKIHVELGEKSASHNRVLYYKPEEITQILADNPDIPPRHFRRTLPTNPDEAAEFVAAFRKRAEKIRRDNPRLRESEVLDKAMMSPKQEIDDGAAIEGDRLSPVEFVDSVRAYLKNGARANSAITNETKAEIIDRLAEIEACFESLDWQFGGIEIPGSARASLIKKVQELIIASERAFRKGELVTRLRDYDTEERAAIYEMVAENYARIAAVLGATTSKAWERNPTLYVEADELEKLRSEHDWLDDVHFQEVVAHDLGNPAEMLRQALQLRRTMKRLHPGLGESTIHSFIASSPARTPRNAMARVRKISETQYRSYGSVKEPALNNPLQIYKYYRTLIRYGQMPRENGFIDKDPRHEERITRILDRASEWLRSQEAMANVDEPTLTIFLNHVEYCIQASEVLKDEGVGPSMVDLTRSAQARIVRAIYENQVDLNELIANGSGSKFRFYDFGFRHETKYMKALWKLYQPYMPRNLVTYVALRSPKRPYEQLNNLVEYRAAILTEKPDLGDDEVTELLKAKINSG